MSSSVPSNDHRDEIAATALRRGPILSDPVLNVSLAPDTALGEFGDGPWEALGSRELIGALPTHPEELADFGGAHQIHATSLAPLLDTVKRWWHTALDSVKRRAA